MRGPRPGRCAAHCRLPADLRADLPTAAAGPAVSMPVAPQMPVAVTVGVPVVPMQIAVAHAPAMPMMVVPMPAMAVPVVVPMPPVPSMAVMMVPIAGVLGGRLGHRRLDCKRRCRRWREGRACSEDQGECELADHSMNSFRNAFARAAIAAIDGAVDHAPPERLRNRRFIRHSISCRRAAYIASPKKRAGWTSRPGASGWGFPSSAAGAPDAAVIAARVPTVTRGATMAPIAAAPAVAAVIEERIAPDMPMPMPAVVAVPMPTAKAAVAPVVPEAE